MQHIPGFSESFTILDAEWDVDEGRRLLFGLGGELGDAVPSHVIVERVGAPGGDRHYLYSFASFEKLLGNSVAGVPLWDALQLGKRSVTPVLEIGKTTGRYRGKAVVRDGGMVVGFVDSAARFGGGQRKAVEFPAAGGYEEAVATEAFPDVEGGDGGDTSASAEGGDGPVEGGLRGLGGTGSGGVRGRGAVRAGRGGRGGVKNAGGRGGTNGAEATERSVVAEMPQSVVKGRTVSLLVSLTEVVDERSRIPVDLPVGSDINIVVQARQGMEVVDGDTDRVLKVAQTGDDEPLPVQFLLRATKIGPATVRVLAFHRGQPLGALTLRPVVVESVLKDDTPGAKLRQTQALAPVSVLLPDLSIWIEERKDGANTSYRFLLNGSPAAPGLNNTPYGPFQLNVDAQRYFQQFFNDIEDLPTKNPDDLEAIEQALSDKGTALFEELFPPDLQALIWSLHDQITSVVIQSDEPWIPWELCRLVGKVNGKEVAGPFLCEAFSVSRWVPVAPFHDTLRLDNVALVVPRDSGLPEAREEAKFMMSLKDTCRKVTRIPATRVDVRAALASGRYDGWHFSGHGAASDSDPDRAVIQLEGNSRFSPSSLTGEVRNLGLGKPIVFLNACQVGQEGFSLTGIGGWGHRFVQAGAGAFIGTYWSIADDSARKFAEALYPRLLNGMGIGQAVREARLEIRVPHDPTWLAYTLMAHPLASVAQAPA